MDGKRPWMPLSQELLSVELAIFSSANTHKEDTSNGGNAVSVFWVCLWHSADGDCLAANMRLLCLYGGSPLRLSHEIWLKFNDVAIVFNNSATGLCKDYFPYHVHFSCLALFVLFCLFICINHESLTLLQQSNLACAGLKLSLVPLTLMGWKCVLSTNGDKSRLLAIIQSFPVLHSC